MSVNIIDDATNWEPIVVAPSAGDAGVAASVQTVAQALADRTAFLNNRGGGGFAARNWSPSSLGASMGTGGTADVVAVTGNKLYWVAVGKPSTSPATAVWFFTSHAGNTWIRNDISKNTTYNDISWDETGQRWCAVGVAATDEVITVEADPSGAASTESFPGGAVDLNVIASNGSSSVAAGDFDSSDIRAGYSTDGGLTWTDTAVAGAASDTVTGIAWNGTTCVLVGTSGGGTIPGFWVSTDSGVNFSAATKPAAMTGTARSVTYDGEKFIAIGTNGQIATSATGAGTWVLLGTTVDGAADTYTKVDADPLSGAILAFDPGANKPLRLSTDEGATWATVSHVSSDFGDATPTGAPVWKAFGFDGSAWVVAGSDGAGGTMWGAQSLVIG